MLLAATSCCSILAPFGASASFAADFAAVLFPEAVAAAAAASSSLLLALQDLFLLAVLEKPKPIGIHFLLIRS
jgi:hypothetical protein